MKLDFIGPIKPQSRKKSYILLCTDYVTKWVDIRALPQATEQTVLDFLYEYVFTMFGVPGEIIIDG